MGRIVARLRQVALRVRGLRQDDNKKTTRGTGPQRSRQFEDMTEQPRITTVSGAIARAGLVGLVIMLPALVVPATPPETAQVLLLVALFAAGVVLAEYASSYPALIEFRFAAPFNRTRFALLALIVLALSLLQRNLDESYGLAQQVAALAAVCGQWLDQPFSPVRQLIAFMPEAMRDTELQLVRDGAALVLVMAATTIAGFLAAIRLQLWPPGQGPFNVWLNLPTFEPTAGNDVVLRLERHARVNIALGVLMPFLLPGLVMASALMIRPLEFSTPVSYVWGIALWAFIPAALIMRGVAMARIARMIRVNRRRFADGETGSFATA